MKQFDLVLKNEKQRSYRRISIFLSVLNFITILFVSFLDNFSSWGSMIIALIGGLSLFGSYYFKKKNERIVFTAVFFMFSLAWLIAGYWIPAILNLLFSFLNLAVFQKAIVNVNENQITYPSFPNKTIPWKDLNNIMLKDDLLTIDFKNNKLIQQLIAGSSPKVTEKEFNEFCQHQLNK